MPQHSIRLVVRPFVAAMTGHGRRWAAACGVDRIGLAVFMSVLVGNLAHLPYRRDDRETDGGFVGIDVTDVCRQPVSILSVSNAIGMPYQTARARVPGMAKGGLLLREAGGLVVPASVLVTPTMRAAQLADRAALAEVVAQLIAVDYPVPAGLTPAMIVALPPSLAARLFLDCLLRSIETIGPMHGGMINGTIIAALVSANIRHLMADPDFARRYPDHDRPPPDSLRRPIPLRQLAREVDMPFETVRRRVHAMAAAGEIAILPEGLIVPTADLVSPRFQQNNTIIVRHFRRLMNDVVRLSR